jgi:hypothetical protein
MLVRFGLRSLALLAVLVPLAASAGCSSSDTGTGAGKAPPNDCKLAEITGVADVTPAFLTYDPPATAPPAMTGGNLGGRYKVDKATVFLPTGSKGLADPTNSTGTVNAWAAFEGTNYRLYLKANLTISSIAGPQSLVFDIASQGGFTVVTSTLVLDHACDTKPPTEAEYTFTDNGSGRATILIKTTSTYGDTYLQLDAAKN